MEARRSASAGSGREVAGSRHASTPAVITAAVAPSAPPAVAAAVAPAVAVLIAAHVTRVVAPGVTAAVAAGVAIVAARHAEELGGRLGRVDGDVVRRAREPGGCADRGPMLLVVARHQLEEVGVHTARRRQRRRRGRVKDVGVLELVEREGVGGPRGQHEQRGGGIGGAENAKCSASGSVNRPRCLFCTCE